MDRILPDYMHIIFFLSGFVTFGIGWVVWVIVVIIIGIHQSLKKPETWMPENRQVSSDGLWIWSTADEGWIERTGPYLDGDISPDGYLIWSEYFQSWIPRGPKR